MVTFPLLLASSVPSSPKHNPGRYEGVIPQIFYVFVVKNPRDTALASMVVLQYPTGRKHRSPITPVRFTCRTGSNADREIDDGKSKPGRKRPYLTRSERLKFLAVFMKSSGYRSTICQREPKNLKIEKNVRAGGRGKVSVQRTMKRQAETERKTARSHWRTI